MSAALRCTYCGGPLRVEMETRGHSYLSYEAAESIECDDYRCGAVWEVNGDLRDAGRIKTEGVS